MSEEPKDTFAAGLDLRRHMFGVAGADQQLESATEFTRPLQDTGDPLLLR